MSMLRRMKVLRTLAVCLGILGMTQSANVVAFSGNLLLESCTEEPARPPVNLTEPAWVAQNVRRVSEVGLAKLSPGRELRP